jgi:hypothetical protein
MIMQTATIAKTTSTIPISLPPDAQLFALTAYRRRRLITLKLIILLKIRGV